MKTISERGYSRATYACPTYFLQHYHEATIPTTGNLTFVGGTAKLIRKCVKATKSESSHDVFGKVK
jgi:hypothetical protein